ncbi:MAG: PAS domain S-box protein, partial [Acidobacteria bacterium]|nr:PAS domain S-box protein [Acidobacteriota bacterium]
QSEATARDILENSGDLIQSVNAEGRFEYVNRTWLETLGYTAQEMRQMAFLDILRPDQVEHCTKIFSALQREELFPHIETVFQTKDGRDIFVEGSTSSNFQDGRFISTRGFFRDVTERKRAEEAIKQLRRQNESILNAAGEGIYGLDLNGNTTFVNPAAAKMIGWKAEELIGKPQHAILHHSKPDGLPYPRENCPIYAAFKDGSVHHVDDEVFWRKDGSSFPVEYISTPIRDEMKRLVGAVVTFQDITERNQAEEALRAKTEQLEAISSAMAEFIRSGDWREASALLLQCALSQTASVYGFAGVVVPGPILRILAHKGIVWDSSENREFYENALRTYRETGYLEFTNFNNLFGKVITSGKPVLSNDPGTDPRSGGLPSGHPPLRHFLGVPIFWKTDVVGLIGVANRPGGYTSAEQDKLAILADTAGVLYDSYRRLEREAALEKALRFIAEGTASVTGADFFRSLVRHLAAILQAHYAFVAECTDSTATRVRTVAYWTGEDWGENIEYSLLGTPCEKAVSGETCYYPEGVQALFPEDKALAAIGAQSYLGIPLFDSSGNVLGHLVVVDDKPMSGELRLEQKSIIEIFASRAGAELERKRAEAEIQRFNQELEQRVTERTGQLQESEDRFRAQYKGLPVSTLTWQRAGEDFLLIDHNDVALVFSRGRIQDFIGKPASKFYNDRPDLLDNMRRCFREKASIKWETPFRMRTTGENKHIAFTYAFIPPDLVMTHTEDITEQKQMAEALQEKEEQLRHAQKMEAIGQLAGGVAHDFNNLLTGIIGYSDVLLKKLGPGHPLLKQAGQIKKAGDQAAVLTGQLLAFSRKQVLQPQVVDLNEIVAGMDEMLRRLVGDNITLVTSLRPALGKTTADPGQIEQVILNLVSNARDAMPKGGTLTIATENIERKQATGYPGPETKAGRHVMLTVTDTGSGMDGETLAHVFEPFFTTKEKGKGTGLGLASVYGIVRQSGGHIQVSSELGRGTKFQIYLSRVDEDKTLPAPKPDSVQPVPSGGWETILLVEDSDQVRELVCQCLQDEGYTVLAASKSAEAVQIAAKGKQKIGMLLTDVIMPGMSGPDLAQIILKDHKDIKVLYLSGYSDHPLVRQGISKPNISFLAKPFTLEALLHKVREVFDVSKSRPSQRKSPAKVKAKSTRSAKLTKASRTAKPAKAKRGRPKTKS